MQGDSEYGQLERLRNRLVMMTPVQSNIKVLLSVQKRSDIPIFSHLLLSSFGYQTDKVSLVEKVSDFFKIIR